jgi:PIN domain nuclease of toxin-antitoxin system
MTRYLLDTNVVLLSLSNQDGLMRNLLDILEDYNNRFYISTISIQEIIHLYKREKIQTNWKKVEDILPAIEAANFEILPVKKEHLITYSKLIPLDSHNDPNDHVIISQAITEKITLISSDGKFERYVKQKLDFIFNSRN